MGDPYRVAITTFMMPSAARIQTGITLCRDVWRLDVQSSVGVELQLLMPIYEIERRQDHHHSQNFSELLCKCPSVDFQPFMERQILVVYGGLSYAFELHDI